MRNVAVLIFVVLLSVAQLGCSSAGNDLAVPIITVENLESLPPSAGQQRFRVTLGIDNPNTEPLPITSLQFTLRLADQGILDGRIAPVTIPALDRESVALEVGSEIISSVSRLRSFTQGPNNALPYELFGRLTLGRSQIAPIPFTHRGEVPLATDGER
jgi:LEA14-like dessication related protein